MRIYDRKTKEYEEIVQYGQGALKFLYGNIFGRIILKIAVSPAASRLYGKINSGRGSKKKIPEFIRSNNIKIEDFEDREYESFNDFFTRKLRDGARVIDTDEKRLISPADAKLLVYDIEDGLRMNIKGRTYSVDEIAPGIPDLNDYSGGKCLVYRLCMDDYHRYCFVDDGSVKDTRVIKGRLHTVSPLSKDYKIYKENHRVVSVLSTKHFGDMINIEVGALLVGKIVNREVDQFTKGEEKGFFEPGGSTIVQLFKKDTVNIDEDIIKQSLDSTETKVLFGEGVGSVC
ncbi:MAG: phosphatidylserine decarboxylase [Lachnospiraceae bacterium]|nr:phosphatidylserine decarboxylase [Lachnospiraceae bacterium]